MTRSQKALGAGLSDLSDFAVFSMRKRKRGGPETPRWAGYGRRRSIGLCFGALRIFVLDISCGLV
jgi:hypothetical protein